MTLMRQTYPNRRASSTRNFGRFESLKALIRTTSSLRWGLLLFRDLNTKKEIISHNLSLFSPTFITVPTKRGVCLKRAELFNAGSVPLGHTAERTLVS